MPCYNVADFIDETLRRFDLIVNGRDDVELIIINDGSTDNSLDIISKKKYPYLRVFTTTNHGVSHARNEGLTQYRGEYVMFLDADDYYERDIFSVLDDNLDNTDLALSSYRRETIAGQVIRRYSVPESTTFFSSSTLLDLFCEKKIPINICSIVIKSSIIKTNKIKFSEDVSHCEDLEFIIKTIFFSHSIHVIRKELFCYVDQPGSAVNKKVGSAQLTKIKVFKEKIPGFFSENNKPLPKYYNFFVLTVFILLMKSALKFRVEKYSQLDVISQALVWLNDKKIIYPRTFFSFQVFLLNFALKVIPFNFIYFISGKLRKK